MKKLVIKRSKWLRGGKDGNGAEALSLLMNKDGHKCCLGFYVRACGYKKALKGKACPDDEIQVPREAKWLLDSVDEQRHLRLKDYYNSNACNNLMMINDNEHFPQSERELKLTKLFAKQGITVIFVD